MRPSRIFINRLLEVLRSMPPTGYVTMNVNIITWSKLLFYLGKAELSWQRNNTERALDHFYAALEMATKGDFKALITFITRRIKELENIITPRLSSQITKASVAELLENV